MTGILNLLMGASSRPSDPYFEYTTLLLPGNGTNGAQNNTFLDGSTNNFTITRNGNTTQGTFSPFSQTGWGAYFDGSNDSVSVASDASWALSGVFSVEAWVWNGGTQTNYPGIFATPTNGFVLAFKTDSSQFGVAQASVAWTSVIAAQPTANTWTHVVVTRDSSNVMRMFYNGVLKASATVTTSYAQGALTIGAQSVSGSLLGYLSNARWIKGSIPTSYQTTSTTVDASIFTPPTTPLTTTSQGATSSDVKLLALQDNRFKDNSNSPFTLTPNNGVIITAFSPFNPTASWSAATYGGSGYFDGNGDYLSVADNTALEPSGSDFTIECWFYANQIVAGTQIIGKSWWSPFYFEGTNLVTYLSSNGSTWDIASNQVIINTVLANTWYHVAMVRSGTSIKAYVNGTQTLSLTTSLSIYDGTGDIQIGIRGTAYLNGYLSSLRMVKGTAVYTSNFTPPTAPLTAITNTSLLLNFTNAGIYDATSKNDLETVGNAQISTAISAKWGSGSMSFDGTGDWLLIPDQPPQRIGTGNFTIEMWVYRNSSGTYGLAGKGTGTTGWLVSLNSSNQVVFTYGSSTITSSGTVSATTWTHIAVVREGTSTNQTKIYIGGTNDGTGTVSTDFNQTNSMYIGADRTGGSAANAYVQDVRITNYARYTGNFTAPTAAFPTL